MIRDDICECQFVLFRSERASGISTEALYYTHHLKLHVKGTSTAQDPHKSGHIAQDVHKFGRIDLSGCQTAQDRSCRITNRWRSLNH